MLIQTTSLLCHIGLLLLKVTSAQSTDRAENYGDAIGIVVENLSNDHGHTSLYEAVVFFCDIGSKFTTTLTFFACFGDGTEQPCFATTAVDNTILYDNDGNRTCDPGYTGVPMLTTDGPGFESGVRSSSSGAWVVGLVAAPLMTLVALGDVEVL